MKLLAYLFKKKPLTLAQVIQKAKIIYAENEDKKVLNDKQVIEHLNNVVRGYKAANTRRNNLKFNN